MNTKTMIAGVMALSIVLSSSVFAQGMQTQGQGGRQQGQDNNADQHQNHSGSGKNAQQGQNNRGSAQKPDQKQQSQRQNNGAGDKRDDRSQQARGAGPGHDMYKGGKLPTSYRNKQYVVDDWRGHNLNAPPRGQQWVQVGGDYVLVAITTGLIMSVLLN